MWILLLPVTDSTMHKLLPVCESNSENCVKVAVAMYEVLPLLMETVTIGYALYCCEHEAEKLYLLYISKCCGNLCIHFLVHPVG